VEGRRLADEFDALWDSTPAAAPAQALTFDALWDSTPATPSGLNAASGQVGKGLALGWFDEIQGVESGLQGLIANVLGRGNGRSFSENYDATVGALRTRDDAYEEANPGTALALQFAGAAAPALLSGGATTGARGIAPLARAVFGVGGKGAPTVGQLVRTGVAGGAVAGAGEADEGDRLVGAAVGAGVGAVAAPVVGKTLEIGSRTIADLAANYDLLPTDLLQRIYASERGSFDPSWGAGGAPGAPAATLLPEEIIVAKQLKNTPIDKILAARAEMEAAGDAPLFLPEAVRSAKVDRNARYIASNEHSMDFARDAIEGRTEGAAARASSILDAVSPERGTYTGASRLVKAADQIITEAEGQRKALTGPLYKDAYAQQPLVTAPELAALVEKDQVLQRAIKDVKKTANNADLPDNSAELLVKARREISDKIETALKNGGGREAEDLTDTYNRLNSILHKNDALKQADEIFAGESGGIDELTGTFLKNLRGMTDDKVNNVGQIFNLPAERIRDLRGTFEKAGKLDEWRAGVRAHMQNVVEGTKDGSNFVNKLTGNTLQKEKIRAALGDEADDVLSGLALEGRMFEGKNKYHPGSSTKGNFDEEAEFKKNVGFIKKMFSSDIGGALQSIFERGGLSEDVAKGIARIYFDPKKGRETLDRIIPLLEKYATNARVAGDLGRVSGGATVRSSTPGLDTVQGQHLLPESAAPQSTAAQLSEQPKLESSLENTRPTSAATQAPGFSPVASTASEQGDLLRLLSRTTGRDVNVDDVKALVAKDPVDQTTMQMESGGDPNAKNENSTASGLFQLIKKTAKSLGVKDVFDPEQNYRGYLKLKTEAEPHVEQPEDYYAYHFLGGPVFRAWKAGKPLDAEQRAQVQMLEQTLLPKWRTLYAENVRRLSGQVEA
jgi:hypothetical protein